MIREEENFNQKTKEIYQSWRIGVVGKVALIWISKRHRFLWTKFSGFRIGFSVKAVMNFMVSSTPKSFDRLSDN